MTNNNHPITPPPELLKRWREEAPRLRDCGVTREEWIATQAARWGSDQELDACCEWLESEWWLKYDHEAVDFVVEDLRAARRPKPPSLKEQALGLLNEGPASDLLDHEVAVIRRALESLSD